MSDDIPPCFFRPKDAAFISEYLRVNGPLSHSLVKSARMECLNWRKNWKAAQHELYIEPSIEEYILFLDRTDYVRHMKDMF